MNGVQEVYMYGGAQTDRVESYINESERWRPGSKLNPFQLLEFIRVSDASSMGDFLRDLDKRGLMSGDFILVHGDLVANVPLDAALAKHKARREANRDACMTMVLREGGDQDHRTKDRGITPVFVVEAPSGRCLAYEEISPLDSDHSLVLDPEILKHPEVELRADLIDCGIDICTPDVLALWSESFDFELPRRNFLHDILNDWELNGKMIYTEIVNEGYAARASHLPMYESVTRDVLGRWTYPLVPDNNLVQGHSYSRNRDGVYLEKDVSFGTLARATSSLVGRHTSIGSRSRISNSTIGRNCKIGNNVQIEGCFLWDNVTIDDDATISRSVLADSVSVGKACAIAPGSLVSFGVRIGDGISFAEPVSLSLFSYDGSPVESDTVLLGSSGRGAAYREDEDADDDTDPSILQRSLIYSTAHLNLSTSSISTMNTHSDSSDEDGSQPQSLVTSDHASRSRLSSFASDDSAAAALKGGSFHNDAVNGLLVALRDDSADFDSAKLEFMGLRLATDASDAAVRRAVAVAFTRRATELLAPENGGLEPAKAAERAIKGKSGASKFLGEVGVGSGETDEQIEFTLALQKALMTVKGLEPTRAGTLLAGMLQQLYSIDILEEDAILAWWEDKRGQEGDGMTALRERCRVLVEWLQNDDEDDSDEESDDDE